MIFSKTAVYQLGLFNSFLAGLYDSQTTMTYLEKKGNCGIGTLNAVHGEVIGFDGKFFVIQEDGIAKEVDANSCLPFANLSFFEETDRFELSKLTEAETIYKKIDQRLRSLNYIYTIQIVGEFENLVFRSECAQQKPYQPLHETLPKLQRIFKHKTMTATMVGFRFPNAMDCSFALAIWSSKDSTVSMGSTAVKLACDDETLSTAAEHELLAAI